MKNGIKFFLNKVGLLHYAQLVYAHAKYSKYKNSKYWRLNIKDLNLIYDTTDSYSSHWFYPRYGNGKIHEPIATKIFIDYIKKDSYVLDVGAHLGYFSCLAGKLASNGKTYAFDVDPKCLDFIKNNCSLNNLKNVSVHNFALSDKNEIVKIQKLDEPNPGLVINSKSNKSYIEVESITVDDFVAQEKIKPNFIKIDVEGAEAKVLKGMRKTLQQDNITLLVEIHVNHLRKYFNIDYKDIINLLLENQFIVENIDHRLKDSTFEKVDINTILKGNTMLLCKKRMS